MKNSCWKLNSQLIIICFENIAYLSPKCRILKHGKMFLVSTKTYLMFAQADVVLLFVTRTCGHLTEVVSYKGKISTQVFISTLVISEKRKQYIYWKLASNTCL